MSRKETKLLTIGEIARRLAAPVHRVAYFIRARGITPWGRAGNLRLFTTTDAEKLRSEFKRHPGHQRAAEVSHD